MNLKEITIVIRDSEEQILKSILDLYKSKFDDFELLKFKKGTLGDEFVVSFKVLKKYYKPIIEKLAYNDLRIFNKDTEAHEIVNEVEKRKQKSSGIPVRGWADLRKKTKTVTIEELQELAVEGKYNEIFHVINNPLNFAPDVVETAKKVISDSITLAINRTYSQGMEKEEEPGKSLSKLIEIASDNNLRIRQRIKDQTEAGFYAIELCLNFPQLSSKLIDISNNSSLPYTVNIKAAVELSDLIFNNKTGNEELLEEAVKKLNTRWLSIAYESAIRDLSPKDVSSFSKITNYVNMKRNR